MLNHYVVPEATARLIRESLPKPWHLRLSSMTAEEQFYALQLVKFGGAKPTEKTIYYLALRVRLIRYFKGQERSLFDEAEWESLARLWRLSFLKFVLKGEGVEP